jgi:hypothetical protein
MAKKWFIFSFLAIKKMGRTILRHIVWTGKKNFKRTLRLEKEERKPKNRIAVIPIDDPSEKENFSSLFEVAEMVKMVGKLSKFLLIRYE